MTASVVGIDIGTAGLRAVEVSDAGRNNPTLVRYHEVQLPDGAVIRGEVVEPNTVAAALKSLWAGGGFKSKKVVLGMGNHRVLARDLTVPKMSIERIRESLPFQAQDMLSVPVADALLDFYPISESDGENGPEIYGLLIAAVKEAVLGNIMAVQIAGLTPVEVDLIPFALSRVINRSSKSDGAVVQIDVGVATTTVAVTLDGVPQFLRLIPAGGGDLTQALALRLDVTPDVAEALKRSLGLGKASNPQQQGAATVISEVTNELLSSLRNTVNYFINTRNHMAVTRIVLTGGGAQLGGFSNALSELTRLPVFTADLAAAVVLGNGVDADALQQTQGAYSVALGLALGSKK
ncbi:type IV pilus assembly protein PilM [Cryobacterium adonitolivorans]|uniref:Type IV pilus assembly protein PilM n=1 Tax=Cryobacterium adonitolivorans TaxID=1259189 RepID=A0A4R8W1M4_9MICO|nr:type IV pilus assembly protein PilM [Cryobacterium adonitolivorans]TFB96791.1 type IV pilus assembly protein PilM [Cryobacterium adonitolivorans]